jgi:hypothetical protein
MIITINDNLTSSIVTDDNLLECVLPSYNPSTLVQFTSASEVEEYIATIIDDPRYFGRKATDEEKAQVAYDDAAKDVRAERNRLLAECDWTQLADASVDNLAWAIYRQALRDIPQQEGFPSNVTYPTKP